MIKIKVDNSVLQARLRRQQQALTKLPDQGLIKFRQLTPLRSGNARKSTDLDNNNNIIADYPYAQRLDQNWSRQTKGQGILKPFERWWVEQIKRIARIK